LQARWTIVTPLNAAFEKIDNNLVSPDRIPEPVRNKKHNRFMDIIPNPGASSSSSPCPALTSIDTAVKLSEVAGDPTSTYYNANYIEGPFGAPQAFIASMGFEYALLHASQRLQAHADEFVSFLANDLGEQSWGAGDAHWSC
jgi:hypothetical protein